MSSTTLSDSTSSASHGHRSDEGILHQFFDAVAANGRAFALFVIGVLALAAIAVAFSLKNDEKADAAANALFIAQKTVGQELKAIADAKKKGATEDTVQFDRFDVDQKLPEGVKALRGIFGGAFKGTRSAYEARLILGNLYFNHGESAKAVAEYEAAVQAAPVVHEKAMAWMALGHAQENLGKLQDALAAYTQAQGAADQDAVRAEALLAQGRVQGLLKDSAKAKAAYEQVMKLLPGSEYARTAETLKARFE